jgi:hypothetical protein
MRSKVSSETESRLQELFAGLPEPDPEVTERALARALVALPAPARRQAGRSARAAVLVLAAALLLLGVAAGALAAAGALHVGFGKPGRHPQRATSHLVVPRGAHGIAATVGGRLWLSTGSGLRLEGLPVSAAELSPHALYVAIGVGNSLVAMAPDGRRAWSHRTPGRVVAVAWAPSGLRIAYVARFDGGFRLYEVEGNGARNRLIDASVRPVRPAWRGDSLALAYVAAGGHTVVYDFVHASRAVVASRGATFLAFAPSGDRLAVATDHRLVVTTPSRASEKTVFPHVVIAGLGWLNGEVVLALNSARPSVSVFRISATGVPMRTGGTAAPGRIEALDASGGRITFAVAGPTGLRVVSTATSVPLLRLPPGSRIGTLTVR